ncbi:MAG: hypothetical protein APR54_09100 [Candidatus Cloacimonas sp. SDB]|nr:MAG: hypothetical protein APR54_09100 [Candidatus Cloacimonas sp. SDB]
MKKLICLIGFLYLTTLAFTVIVNFAQIPQEYRYGIIPDLEGKVIVTSDFWNEISVPVSNSRDLPVVMDGFPVSYTVSNCYKGAIYTDMDDDPEMEIIYGVGTKIAALNLDGSAVPGWPVNNTYYIWSSPACGDIDADGVEEIVATSRNNTTGNIGELYAYELDGTPCSGFPVSMAGGGTMNACLSDIDDDGDMEIFVNVRNHPEGWVYGFQGDGTVIEGWPAALDYVPGASISVGDLDNDGVKEVVALSYYSLYVFDLSGNVMPGFPYSETGTTVSYSQPLLYDMDADGDLEILYGACTDAGGKVFAFHHDGSLVAGWPKITSSWIFATVTLGDINGDGELDVVVGDQVSSQEASNYIYAWDMAGNDLTDFPAGPTFAIYAQAAIADIDGDGEVEIMIDDNRFGIGYECYNHDGTHDDEWPLQCGTIWSSTTMMITPVIGDFNGDGLLDITGAATDIMGWVVEAYAWTTDSAWNEDLAYSIIDGHNVQHDGLYPVAEEFFPQPPQNVSAEVFNINSIVISWDPPESELPSGYNVYLEEEILGVTTENTFTADGFDEGIYNLQVSATYPGEYESEPVAAEPVEIYLIPPFSLTYEVIPTPEVILNWEFPVNRGLEAFVIYRDGEEIDQTVDLTYTDLTAQNETSYEYYVTAWYTGDHESISSNTVNVYVTGSGDDAIPDIETRLTGNHPNPFNPNTTILFSIKATETGKLRIFNLIGKLILEKQFGSGSHEFFWNAAEQTSGIYFYSLETDSYKKINKMILLK